VWQKLDYLETYIDDATAKMKRASGQQYIYMGCSDVSEFEHIYGHRVYDAILCVRQIVYMNKNGGF